MKGGGLLYKGLHIIEIFFSEFLSGMTYTIKILKDVKNQSINLYNYYMKVLFDVINQPRILVV